MDTGALRNLIYADARFVPAIADHDAATIADLLNVRPVIGTENPEPQGTIFVLPGSMIEVMGMIPAAEKGAIIETTWQELAGPLYATHEDACNLISAFLIEIHRDTQINTVAAVASMALGHDQGNVLAALISLLVASEKMSPATAQTLTAAITAPDPTWHDTLYEYGDSAATVAGLPRVELTHIQEAMDW